MCLFPPVPPGASNMLSRNPRHAVTHARLIITSLLLLIAATPAAADSNNPLYDDAFNTQWHDGKAELASYDLIYPRYGEKRIGTAVTIVVTEPFNNTQRVKSDADGPNTFDVIKLNLVEDFPTGVYDYNLMTSVFVATQSSGPLPAGATAKISFSSQEWCGHVWQQAAFRPVDAPNTVAQVSHSYFETEADDTQTLQHPPRGMAEDALILWARGLAGPPVELGKTVTIPLYRSMAIQRLQHVPAQWDTATLTRHSTTQATAHIASNAGDRTYTFTLNLQGVLQTLERSDGYTLKLRNVERLPYWNQHDNTHQSHLKSIGLEPRGPGQM